MNDNYVASWSPYDDDDISIVSCRFAAPAQQSDEACVAAAFSDQVQLLEELMFPSPTEELHEALRQPSSFTAEEVSVDADSFLDDDPNNGQEQLQKELANAERDFIETELWLQYDSYNSAATSACSDDDTSFSDSSSLGSFSLGSTSLGISAATPKECRSPSFQEDLFVPEQVTFEEESVAAYCQKSKKSSTDGKVLVVFLNFFRFFVSIL